MEVTRSFVRTFIFIFGNLVLVSYVYGLSHAPDKNALWGGIPWSQAKFIVPFMFLAAFGFLMYWWIILYQNEAMGRIRWRGRSPFTPRLCIAGHTFSPMVRGNHISYGERLCLDSNFSRWCVDTCIHWKYLDGTSCVFSVC